MLKQIYNWLTGEQKRTSYPLNATPAGYWQGMSEYNVALPGRLPFTSPEQALTLPAFFMAVRLYQQSASSLPLVTYVKDTDGDRERLKDKATYNILHERPNPAQSRAVFIEQLVHDYWLYGEAFVQISWANNHRLLGLYPIPAHYVSKIQYADDWKKTYYVNGMDDPLQDDEVIHVINFSRDGGLRGCSFLRYASESLGLHKQILDSATSLYANMPRVSGVMKQTSAITKEAKEELRNDLRERFSGPQNAGGVLFTPLGAEFSQLDHKSAADALIVDALNMSTMSVAQWFGLSPLLLADLSRGTYSNSAADKLAFYQKNLMPVLEKIQLEFNHKLFGAGADTYCEFLTDAVLRADPLTQSQVWHNGITDGYLLRSECRRWLNLPAVEGIDDPPEPPAPPEAEQPQEDDQQQDTPEEQAAEEDATGGTDTISTEND